MMGRKTQLSQGFTLVEVVMAIAISTMVFSGIIMGYVQATRRSEWTGYSLAAQAIAIQQLERARSAKWDVLDTPTVDEMTNMPSMTYAVLDIPISGSNVTYVTNFVSMKTITVSSNPVSTVRLVKVDTVWPFAKGHRLTYYTNSIANYFAPDR